MPRTRAGRYERQAEGYRAFIPAPLPPRDLRLTSELQSVISEADMALGRLDGVVNVVPDPDLFVVMYVRREAVLSSQIEGTQASLMDLLEFEAAQERAGRGLDVEEIVNYVAAMNHGLRRLSDIPLARRLICEVHAVLMREVRGGEPHKTPGEFRRSQNWIGGGSPATARFVPPPAHLVDEAFADLERFLHDPEPMPPLVKAALAHAQFETIHPFLDGNGRVGRLLITFWLMARRILQKPLLYPSLYFKENRTEYVDRLQAIRDEGKWEEWVAFFAEGIARTATEATDRAMRIVALRDRSRDAIARNLGRRTPNAFALLDRLFTDPVVSAKRVEKMLSVSQPTATALVNDLAQIGILHEMTGKKRNRLFAFDEYLGEFPGADRRS